MNASPPSPTHTEVRNRTRRLSTVLLIGIALTAILAAAGCRTSAATPPTASPQGSAATTAPRRHETTTTVVRPTAPVDELVSISSGRMHVTCRGSGPVTVVLIAGFGDAGTSWTNVAPAVAHEARVCLPTKFGLGTSDPPPTTQTFATQATDLRAALRTLDEPGPYVVVGHSFGGALAVTFAAQNPADVHGLMLLDASPATWPSATCTVPNDGTPKAQELAVTCAMFSPENNAERLDAPAAFAAADAITSLGALPLVVTTAAHHAYSGLAAEQEARLNDVWNAGQQHWLTLSSSSQLVPVDNTGHLIQLDQPSAVIEQITQLI